MARLRQRNPGNYGSSTNISAEFENLVRYINAAEFGNKTIGELLAQLFNSDGIFDGPIEMRLDSSSGLQYRLGDYGPTDDTGWNNIASLDQIRGPAGRDVGEIGAPIFYGRYDYTAGGTVSSISYAHASTDTLVVYKNGLLLVPGVSADYTTDATADTITFTSNLVITDKVTVYKVRATSVTGFTRTDTVTVAPQAVFPFVHDDTSVLQVYKNGILQRSGGAYDYTSDAATDTVTFTSTVLAGNTVSIITVENTATTAVTGLMMEEQFCDPETGLILYENVTIQDDEIPVAKIDGLTAALNAGAKITIDSISPESPAAGNFWLDTSQNPNVLKFYDGTDWLLTSPESTLPDFSAGDAGKVIAVNLAGTALEYQDVDLSSVIPITQKGAANGVATLDSDGRVPVASMPTEIAAQNFYFKLSGAASNTTYVVARVFKQKMEIVGWSVIGSSGTATAQLALNGTGVGSTAAVSSTINDISLGTVQAVDASANSVRLGVIITSNSSLQDLEVVIAARTTG